MARKTIAQKILTEIQKTGELNHIFNEEAICDSSLEFTFDCIYTVVDEKDYEGNAYDLRLSGILNAVASDELGKLMQLVMRVAMMEQLKEVRLGEDPPHEIVLFAEDVDGDTDEWDTIEEPPITIPTPRAPRAAKSFSCMTGETTHRWFKSTGNTYECSICKSNRTVTQLTKHG